MLKVLHENGNHGRADDSRYVTHHLASFITETAQYDTSHAHSPYRYEEKAAHQGRESKYTCTRGGTYDAFQAVLDFLCCHVLRCVFDVHARIDVLAVNSNDTRIYGELRY